jgi:YD repeat-containing protein
LSSPQTGQVASIDYASSSNPNLRTYDYAYDVFGNLVQQDLNGGATRETYDYDAVQRLTEATRTGGASGTVDYAYDAIGNLTSKSDFSTTAANAYAYTGAVAVADQTRSRAWR